MVFYVIIDEPQGVEKQADSSIATKLTSRVLKEVLPALGIYPEGEIDYLLADEQEDNSQEEEGLEENLEENLQGNEEENEVESGEEIEEENTIAVGNDQEQ